MKIAIIGGGLAGCAAAYVLKQAGHSCVIYEAGDTLASGASGNRAGLYNPRFGADFNPQSQYYSAAFCEVLEVFSALGDIDFLPLGCLHLITDEKKQIRFSKMLKNWVWSAEGMRIIPADEASAVAGVDIGHDALYVRQSGSVSPAKLCAAYARGVEVHLNTRVDDLADLDADIVILAAGPALRGFEASRDLSLYAVRGQVSVVKETPQTRNLKCHVNYNGYITAGLDGVHMVGSTFQRWAEHDRVMAEDDVENLEKLAEFLPQCAAGLEVIDSRASVRTTSKDYFPVVGALSDRVYISSAHGSHGLVSSLMAAQVLRSMIENKPQALADEVIAALSPGRFFG